MNNKATGKKKKRNGKKGMQRVQQVANVGASARSGKAAMARLDSYAREYAKLLADPCAARLVPSVFPGAGGAIMARFEQDLVLFNGIADTAGWLVWCPAATRFIRSAGLANDTTLAGPTSAGELGPGTTFLEAQQSFRCVSGCMQVYFAGTENNRAGFVSVGYAAGNQYANLVPALNGGGGGTVSVSQLRQNQFHTERTPNTYIELKYKPVDGDASFASSFSTGVTAGALGFQLEQNSCLTLGVSGLAPSTGIRVRFVGVYEYVPAPGTGFVSTVGNAPPSHNTHNEVMRALEAGGNWFLQTAAQNWPGILTNVISGATMLI